MLWDHQVEPKYFKIKGITSPGLPSTNQAHFTWKDIPLAHMLSSAKSYAFFFK